MIILGIDPGTAATGYSLIKRNFKEIEILNFGCIKTDKSLPKDKRLKIIFNETSSLIKTYQPEILAIESLFFNKNIRTALSVGEAKGVILLAASLSNLKIVEYTPLQVKESLVGYGRATKKEIKEMVRIYFNLADERFSDDAADAVAIVLCHLNLEALGI